MRNRLTTIATALALAAFVAVSALAQGDKEKRVVVETHVGPQGDVVIEKFVGPEPGQTEAKGDTFVFVSSEMSFDRKVVKGSPYSAQAVTETVQALADGNRIVRRNTAQVYRDSEGRTRRDQTLGSIGPFAAAGDPPRTVLINDPVANVNYMLDPRTKTARKLPRLETRVIAPPAPESGKQPERRKEIEVRERKEVEVIERKGVDMREHKVVGPPSFVFATPAPGGGPFEMNLHGHTSKAESKTEQLGTRTVEGVEAEGTRTVTTIPAGEIGNEMPIEIVHERWYSPALQQLVMTRHSDPRFGETTYRLTNIVRSEPAPTLFQVPSDYTVKEMPRMGPGVTVRTNRRPSPEK